MNSLTTEQIAKKFAQYLGCTYKCDVEDLGPIHLKVSGETLDSLKDDVHIHNPQLILKPLSSISDEHAIEVAKMCIEVPGNKIPYIDRQENFVQVNTHGYHIVKIQTDVFHIAYYNQGSFTVRTSVLIQIYQYLTSLGYDLSQFIEPNHPDNGKTMQEMGLAVYL